MRRRHVLLAATCLVGVVAAGCGGNERSAEQAASDEAFGWTSIGDGVEEGSLTVPVDYDDPSKGTATLYLVRHLATDTDRRIGSLLVNPGGPGFGGSVLARQAPGIYGSELIERFDIIGFDPRGTGRSTPAIDCIDDLDRTYGDIDITPDDDAEQQQLVSLAEEFAAGCAEATGADFLPYVGTNNVARDMDAIRAALGEERISYFGFSYGSELGATWATLFPDTVRAAVLDGAADPGADPVEATIQQSIGFEDTLSTFLTQCAADNECPFHNDGDPSTAFDALMVSIDEQPITALDGRPLLTRSMAVTAVARAMYSNELWPTLADALADAQAGDGSGLMTLYDDYYGRTSEGTYSDELEAFQVISCMDDERRLTIAEEDAAAERYRAAAPRFAPGTTGSYGCVFLPAPIDPRADVTGDGAGPILVMGTTGDAATPLASTELMADALEDGRLVIVEADQHTGYGFNRCSQETIDEYLIDPVANAPADGTRCP
jgi:pimeloyl-ACP methyl ester carboxylesterase